MLIVAIVSLFVVALCAWTLRGASGEKAPTESQRREERFFAHPPTSMPRWRR